LTQRGQSFGHPIPPLAAGDDLERVVRQLALRLEGFGRIGRRPKVDLFGCRQDNRHDFGVKNAWHRRFNGRHRRARCCSVRSTRRRQAPRPGQRRATAQAPPNSLESPPAGCSLNRCAGEVGHQVLLLSGLAGGWDDAPSHAPAIALVRLPPRAQSRKRATRVLPTRLQPRTADDDRRQEGIVSSRGSRAPGKERVRTPGPHGTWPQRRPGPCRMAPP
jgi:hypothetical protein